MGKKKICHEDIFQTILDATAGDFVQSPNDKIKALHLGSSKFQEYFI